MSCPFSYPYWYKITTKNLNIWIKTTKLVELSISSIFKEIEMEMKMEERIETEKKAKKTMSESMVEIETTAMVALGVVLLIAGAKHALASLVEQWRATVFLCLNLLLLAILFTSNIPSNSNHKSSSSDIKIKSADHIINKNKIIKSSIKKAAAPSLSKCMSPSASVQIEDYLCHPLNEETTTTSTTTRIVDEKIVKEEDDVVVNHDKEDLNARVEAFIVMFRQQLAMDNIAKGRSSSSSSSVPFASSTTQGARRASFSL